MGKVDVQTALVLLGVCVRPRIRRRALRALSLDPRTVPNVALRAVRLPLVELAIIVRMAKERCPVTTCWGFRDKREEERDHLRTTALFVAD